MTKKANKLWSVISLRQIRNKFYAKNADDSKTPSDRGHWGHRMEFFLATLGYSVGIGNITRFPYLCMKNGGGAFLIPFICALIAGGVPLFYAELVLGQFSGLSPLTMWSFCPIFRGVGYACVLLSGIVTIYYNMLLGWCLFYLVKSLASDVPWRGCNNHWNTEKCYDPFTASKCQDLLANSTIPYNNASDLNCTAVGKTPPEGFLLPSEDFWNNVILGVNSSPGIDNIGSLRWQLVLALFAAWLMVFCCLMKGVRSTGKVVYVTATAPYFLLTALLIRGVTLDGAADGLIFYLKPNFSMLADHNVWIEASLQMFYSLGPAWGGLITMASYNKFNHKLYVEAVAIPFTDVFTALYGGFAIFSVIGFMAKQTRMPIKRFASAGVGLAFVVYPQAIAEMPVSPLWSILFFLTLLTLGIDSQFGMCETVTSGLFDLFPKLRSRKTTVIAAVIAVCFVLGLPLCCENGMYLYALVDWYAGTVTITVVAFIEIIVISYIYGINRFSSDIKLMIGSKPNILWRFSWLILTPFYMGALLFVGLWNLQAPSYGSYAYPSWAVVIGWIIALISFAPIPGFAIYAVMTSPHKSITQKMSSVFLPTDQWIPAKSDLVDGYLAKHAKKRRKKANQQQLNYHNHGERCIFCRELGGADGNNQQHMQPVKCESLFKCWVCFCTCRIFGLDRDITPKSKNNDDESAVNKHATVNPGFTLGDDDDDDDGNDLSSIRPASPSNHQQKITARHQAIKLDDVITRQQADDSNNDLAIVHDTRL